MFESFATAALAFSHSVATLYYRGSRFVSEHYIVLHHGENLYKYNMTSDEKAMVDVLRHECIETLDRLNIPREKLIDGRLYMGRLLDNHDFKIGYKEKIGYYVLDGERGVFTMRAKFPEINGTQAKFRILTYEFLIGGIELERINRSELQGSFGGTYFTEYDSRKAAFEHAIQKHFDAQSCFIEEVIAEYTGHMNIWFENPHWYFNKEVMLFEEL
jgi:hypothetical protein